MGIGRNWERSKSQLQPAELPIDRTASDDLVLHPRLKGPRIGDHLRITPLPLVQSKAMLLGQYGERGISELLLEDIDELFMPRSV